MGIAPRQIGWSNESNLLWNISKQLDRLTAVMANISPGGGGTNPTSTFVPFNNAGTFADSFLVNDTTASVLKTVYSASDIGLKLDFANMIYEFGGVIDLFGIRVNSNNGIDIGDYIGFSNGQQIRIVGDVIKTEYLGNEIGLKLDFANDVYVLGDYNGVSNHTYITVDNANALITLLCSGYGVSQQFDGINGNVEISSQNIIKTTNNGNEIGLKLDFANGTYNLGDFGAAVNGSFLGIDDSNECWVTSNNVTETTAGASANKYILVKIGSTVYKLQLFNYA